MRNNSYVGIIVLMVLVVALFSYGSLGFGDLTGNAVNVLQKECFTKLDIQLKKKMIDKKEYEIGLHECKSLVDKKDKKSAREEKSEKNTPLPPPVESSTARSAQAAVFVPCTETDSGDVPSVLGYHTGTYPVGDTTNQVPDQCRLNNNQPVDFCTNCKLMEYYCRADGYLFWHFYENVACEDGALSVVSLTPETVDLAGDNLYYNMSISDVMPVLTDAELDLLADQVFGENVGPTANSVPYTQTISFGPAVHSGRFLFSQDDRDLPDADSALFFDNSPNLDHRIFAYEFAFSPAVSYVSGQASADLVGSSLVLLGELFEITVVVETSSGLITSLTLTDGTDTYVLEHGNIPYKNGNPIPGWGAVIFDSSSGSLAGFDLNLLQGPDELYMTAGDSYVDTLFDKVSLNFDGVEGGTFQPLNYLVGATSGEISFNNPDGLYYEIDLSADASYIAGNNPDEPVFLGSDAPSSTVGNVDELLYLQGETCQGTNDITDCVGAEFLVQDSISNLHTIRITDIDTVDDEVDFVDLAYGTTATDLSYVDSLSTSTIFMVDTVTFNLAFDESLMRVSFDGVVGDGDVLEVENGATLEIVNNDLSTQIYEPWLYSDPVAWLGPYDVQMVVEYDDVTDNTMKVSYLSTYPWNDFIDSVNGMGFFDASDINDDFIEFMTYYGTHVIYDREDQQSMVFNVPSERVYAQVELVTTP